VKAIITIRTIDPGGSVLPYPPAVFADQELEDEYAAADEVIEQRLGRPPAVPRQSIRPRRRTRLAARPRATPGCNNGPTASPERR